MTVRTAAVVALLLPIALFSLFRSAASRSAAQGTPAPDATPSVEASPTATATIHPVVWQLTAIDGDGGEPLLPDDPARYTVQFLPDGTLLIRADCNTGRGPYQLTGDDLTVGPLATTRAACGPQSIDGEFLLRLQEVASYAFDGDDLRLDLAADAGALHFAPALTGVVWEWQAFEGGDGNRVAPPDPAAYTLEFLDDGAITVRADCNRGRGTSAISEDAIDLAVLALTRAACPPGSLSNQYLRDLDAASSYLIRDGQLHLALPADAGILTFAARPPDPAVPPATPAAP